MSKFLDDLRQTELDRVALAEAETRAASERLARALAEQRRAQDEEAERNARARAEAEARALQAAQERLAAEREAKRAAQARMDAVAEAGRIARERMVVEIELRRAAQARAEEEANAALAARDSEAPALAEPLSRQPRRAAPRRRRLALVAAFLLVLAAGIAIGVFVRLSEAVPAPGVELGLKLDRNLEGFAGHAARQEKK